MDISEITESEFKAIFNWLSNLDKSSSKESKKIIKIPSKDLSSQSVDTYLLKKMLNSFLSNQKYIEQSKAKESGEKDSNP